MYAYMFRANIAKVACVVFETGTPGALAISVAM
jgi:hypothetical protein